MVAALDLSSGVTNTVGIPHPHSIRIPHDIGVASPRSAGEARNVADNWPTNIAADRPARADEAAADRRPRSGDAATDIRDVDEHAEGGAGPGPDVRQPGNPPLRRLGNLRSSSLEAAATFAATAREREGGPTLNPSAIISRLVRDFGFDELRQKCQ